MKTSIALSILAAAVGVAKAQYYSDEEASLFTRSNFDELDARDLLDEDIYMLTARDHYDEYAEVLQAREPSYDDLVYSYLAARDELVARSPPKAAETGQLVSGVRYGQVGKRPTYVQRPIKHPLSGTIVGKG